MIFSRGRMPIFLIMMVLCASFAGCASTSQGQLLAIDESQVALRSIQTRAFDTLDKEDMMRTVISVLQDLDFVLQDANLNLGTVSGQKFVKNTVLKMTVTVRPRGETQLLVRGSAQFGIKAVSDPLPYQDFFNALQKGTFLTAHHVD